MRVCGYAWLNDGALTLSTVELLVVVVLTVTVPVERTYGIPEGFV